jgi:polysaccharide biosynthesis protein PslH
VNVLFLATRSPWPSVDGGRVLMAGTLEGLRSRGHTVTVVAPTPDPSLAIDSNREGWLRIVLVPVHPRPLAVSVVRSLVRRHPESVMRHAHPSVAAAVSELLSLSHFHVVHVQQLHALPFAAAALSRNIPVVLRAENVESDLWFDSAASRRWWRPLLRFEARKVARWERAALDRVAITVALTEKDARRLHRLSPDSRIQVVRAPMPSHLPIGDGTLAGEPALVLLAGRWFPNRDGVTWFMREIWPAIFASRPTARLHLFGSKEFTRAGAGVVRHPSPDAARTVFVPDSIFIVPLRIAAGASVRILEAWARGVPVIATPIAAAGLDVQGGDSIALARTPLEFTRAVTLLCETAGAAGRATAAGRQMLRERHDPDHLAQDLDRSYVAAIEQRTGRMESNAP